MELSEAITCALDGRALLFVGSGFSVSARNVNGKQLPTGSLLARAIAAKCDLPEEPTPALDSVADYALSELGSSELIRFLHSAFQVASIAAEHHAYGRIPWRRVYTTNYDATVELAFRAAGQAIVPLVPSSRPQRLSEPVRHCVHLNGSIDNLTVDTLESEFRLTTSSYASGALASTEWAAALRHDLLQAQAVFFVGYSTYDLDIKRLLAATTTLQRKTFFVVGKVCDPIQRHALSKFGEILLHDTVSFAEALVDAADSYIPVVFNDVPVTSIEEIVAPSNVAPTTQDVAELFLHGRFTRASIWLAANGAETHRSVCMRRQLETVLSTMSSANVPIVVTSELGNGKTLFLETLGGLALSRGYRVFLHSDASTDALRDIENICALRRKTLLLVDDYVNKRDDLELLGRLRSPDLRLVLSARSIRHDVAVGWLAPCLAANDLVELDLDRLEADDIEWFNACLEQYGLWGSSATLSEKRRVEHLLKTCGGSISGILLEVMRAPQIASRLQALISSIGAESGAYLEAVTSLLLLSLLGLSRDAMLVGGLVDAEVLNSSKFRRIGAVRELFDFSYGANARSSVVARHLLIHGVQATVIVACLIRMVRLAEPLRSDGRYRNAFITLMKAREVQAVLPESGRARTLAGYYNELTQLRGCRANQQFWLQYAIAMILLKQYDEARLRLETAYSHAGQEYDTYMLDNTSARLSLLERIDGTSDDPDALMASFRAAKKHLHKQVSDKEEDRRYAAFQVATHYKAFYDRFQGVLPDAARTEVRNAAQFMLKKANAAIRRSNASKAVQRCQAAMTSILESSALPA